MLPPTPPRIWAISDLLADLAAQEWAQRPATQTNLRDAIASIYAGSAFNGGQDVYRPWTYSTTGVVGDAEFAAAIAAVPSATGGIIDAGPGTFLFTGPLTLSKSGVKLKGAGRNATILRFTGATDGIVLSDNVSLSRIGIEDLQIQTTNAAGGKAIKADFHTSGGTEHIIRDVAITASGSGRWTHGFFGNNFETSNLENVRVVQSATVGMRFENFSNSINLKGCEVTGSSGIGTIARGLEIVSTTDLQCEAIWLQGYFTQSCIYIDGSGPRFYGGHIENTNAAPSDGADILVSTNNSINGVFYGLQGGSYLLGAGSATLRNFQIIGGEAAAIVLSAFTQNCAVIGVRAASITDNQTNGVNTILACSSATGAALANKIPTHFVRGNTTVIPNAVALTTAAILLGNASSLSALTSAAAVHELLFMSAGDQTYLQFLSALNVRNTAGTQFAQMTATQWRLIAGMAQTIESSNGAVWTYGQTSELLTLSTVAAFTDSVGNLLPANSIIEAVVVRVTTAITVATDWSVGDAATANRFAAANATMTLGATSTGLRHQQGGIATDAAGPGQTAAAKVRISTTGTPSAGAVRITVFYRQFTAPTS